MVSNLATIGPLYFTCFTMACAATRVPVTRRLRGELWPRNADALGPDVPGDEHGGLTVPPDTDAPHLPFDDPTQHRYEILRPIVVFGDRNLRANGPRKRTRIRKRWDA